MRIDSTEYPVIGRFPTDESALFTCIQGLPRLLFDVTKKNMIKEQIINTAFDLFSQYGIKSVSMDDVAKAAGISKRTLYESFEDKETLLIEGIDHNTESLGQYLTGLEKRTFQCLGSNPALL